MKKTIVALLAASLMLSACSPLAPPATEPKQTEAPATQVPATEEPVTEPPLTEAAITEPVVTEKKEPVTEAPRTETDFSQEDLTEENVRALVEDVFSPSELKVRFEDGGHVFLEYYDRVFTSGLSMLRQHNIHTLEVAEKLFQNPDLQELWFSYNLDMKENNGFKSRDEAIWLSISRDSISGVDLEELRKELIGDPDQLQKITTGYGVKYYLQEQ